MATGGSGHCFSSTAPVCASAFLPYQCTWFALCGGLVRVLLVAGFAFQACLQNSPHLSVVCIACEPSTAVCIACEPSTAVCIACEPPTAVCIACEPSTAVCIACEPSTAVCIACEPSTAVCIACEPSTAVCIVLQ